MRSLKLKVCGMREANNIADVADLRPDYMGFIFVPSSPRFIGDQLRPDQIALPSSTHRVGVFKDAAVTEVVEYCRAFGLHGAQLHGSENEQYMRTLKEALPQTLIIKAINVNSQEDLASLAVRNELPDIFLFDGKNPGSGKHFDWDLLSHYNAPVNFLLAGGIEAQDIPEVLLLANRFPRMVGIDINSRVESAPGVKDINKIKEVLRRLES